jgi:quinol-cytochrome oxidoreductase complex cytochrome b subunit
VDDAMLNRFFSLHFFLPFVILALSIIHILFLHEFGSNNPVGVVFRKDGSPMTPYYLVKDVFGLNLLLVILFYCVFFIPNLLGHPDNYILGNALVTPPHIVPE